MTYPGWSSGIPVALSSYGKLTPRLKSLVVQYCSREHVSAALFACAILLALNSPPIISMRMGLYLWCLVAGYYFAPKRTYWSKEVALCLIIGVSALIAIPVSLFIDGRNTPATAFLASVTLLLLPLLFVTNVSQIFYALIPGWFLQAAVTSWQWFIEGVSRAGGIAENENAGSSFLLLGAIFLMNDKRLKWLSVPLLMAIPFSGSRWVLIVAAFAIGAIFLSKQVRWKWLLAGIAVALASLIISQYDQLSHAYRINRDIQGDVTMRANTQEAEFSFSTIWMPRGFHDTGLHSLTIRMADETGLLSALAWIGVGAITLYRRPRFTWQWWSMAALILLSVMYYFVWILLPFWWLLINPSRESDACTRDLYRPVSEAC